MCYLKCQNVTSKNRSGNILGNTFCPIKSGLSRCVTSVTYYFKNIYIENRIKEYFFYIYKKYFFQVTR